MFIETYEELTGKIELHKFIQERKMKLNEGQKY
jgi:hypothetical protein